MGDPYTPWSGMTVYSDGIETIFREITPDSNSGFG
tara:strand:- start:284 stop:388 length:105 start_codon:yes stop_codon:yes gene_type:complete